MDTTVTPPTAVAPPEGVTLSARTRAIIAAVAEAALPTGGKLLQPPGEICADKTTWFIRQSPWLVGAAFLAGLWLLELAAVLFYGRTFSKLGPEQRTAWLDKWHHSPLFAVRIALRGVVTPIKLAYFAEPEVARAVGYEYPNHQPSRPPLASLPGRSTDALTHEGPLELKAEVVVVGTGAGGAVVAKELAELGRDVLLLEEGHWHSTASFNKQPFDMTAKLYRDMAMTVALGKPGIPIPLGKTVGGTTTINSGTCFRLPEKTLKKWDAKGVHFTSEELAPLYEKVERILEVGPVAEPLLGKNGEIIKRGAAALGMTGKPLLRNASGCHGSGLCCFGCPTEAKKSTNVTYVPKALEAGAHLVTGVKVTRVLTEGGRAVGVEGVNALGQAVRVRADAVVLAAGTLYTPLILKKSRLTGRSHQVGRNLSIHPASKVNALFEEKVKGWIGVPQGMWIEDLAERGIVFEGAMMPPDFGSIGIPMIGQRFMEIMGQYDHISTFGFLVEDSSQGRVYLGPDGRPVVLYDVSRAELEKIREGIEVLTRIYLAAGAKIVFPPLTSVPEVHGEADIAKFPAKLDAADLELTAFHPLGTCRMGTDPHTSVIDTNLEHHEVERLFLCDGSIFPSSLGRNPQLTIMAFATREAGIIDRRLKGEGRLARAA